MEGRKKNENITNMQIIYNNTMFNQRETGRKKNCIEIISLLSCLVTVVQIQSNRNEYKYLRENGGKVYIINNLTLLYFHK